MTKILFKKTIVAVLAAALAFAASPFTAARAADDEPPPAEGRNGRLERNWARQLRALEHLGRAFDASDEHLGKLQDLIDKAAAEGKDVASLQAALDAFEAALTGARPAFASAQEIANAHSGFDADGKVIDAEQARSTMQEMRVKLQEIKSQLGGTGRALRQAVRAFHEANKPAEPPRERDS